MIHSIDDEGQSLAHVAIRKGRSDILVWLLEQEPDLLYKVDNKGKTLVDAALEPFCQEDLLEILFEKAPTLTDKEGRTLVQIAAADHLGRSRLLKKILDKQPSLIRSVDDKGRNLAHIAAAYNRLYECTPLQILFEREPDLFHHVDNEGKTIAHVAVEKGVKSTIMFIFEKAPDLMYRVDNEGRNLAHIAIEKDNASVLEYILEQAPDLIRSVDNEGRSLIHVAVEKGTQNILFSIFREAAPDLIHDADNEDGGLVFKLARLGWQDALECLLDKAPDLIHRVDDNGNTLAHIAVEEGDEYMLWDIVSRRDHALIHRVNNEGKNLVQTALECDNVSMFSYLLTLHPELANSLDERAGNLPQITIEDELRFRIPFMLHSYTIRSIDSTDSRGRRVSKTVVEPRDGHMFDKLTYVNPELARSIINNLAQIAFDQDKSEIYKFFMENTPEFKSAEEGVKVRIMAELVAQAVEEGKPKILQMLIEKDYSLVLYAALARPRG